MTSDRESAGDTAPGTGAGPDRRLHLPSLSIQGFRGIKELSIPRMGRVTLLAGRNGVGKTTVLDAVRVYASRARQAALSELLVSREENTVGMDAKGVEVIRFDATGLFYGRDMSESARISIGSLGGEDRLRIEIVALRDDTDSVVRSRLVKQLGIGVPVMQITFGDSVLLSPPGPLPISPELMRWLPASDDELPPELACESLGPGLPGTSDVARLWDRVALTDEEDRVVGAMNLAVDEEAVRVAVVGDGARSGQGSNGHRVVARLKGHGHPVPLKSLGDGAVRLLGVALALGSSRDGFLLIDEAENGIHHALQRDFWRMVLQTAQDNNIQVLATTHGWDCVRGFAQAAVSLDAVEGVLVRLERSGDRIRAVEYTEDELVIAAQEGIEMR